MRTRRQRCCATAMPGCGGCSARRCPAPRSCWTGGTPLSASSTRGRRPAALAQARLTHPAPTRSSHPGACEVVSLARALDGVPAQTRCPVPLDKTRAHTRGGRHWPPPATRYRPTGYLERNQAALVPDAARRRCGEPISTAFVESAVNEIVAKRMNKAQQMRWNRASVQPFLDVRTAVLNGTLEDAFRQRYPGFRPANDDHKAIEAAA